MTDLYANHVAECQRRWELCLAAEGYSSAIIHAGSEIIRFMDDWHYPFRPNPHFLSWLPLTRHHDSVLIVRSGKKPELYYHQPDDYWSRPPEDPEPWWADQFDVHLVREAEGWKKASRDSRTALVGDAPSLTAIAADGNLNPARLINRIHLERTRKTEYEIACMQRAGELAAIGHIAAERAFRDGASEYQIHQVHRTEVI